MHEIIFDDSFCIEKTNDYILSIQVSLDGFSFSILNENLLLAFQHTPLKISNEKFIARRFQEWLENKELLQLEFKKINVVIDTHIFTLIPVEIYSNDKSNELLLPLFDIQSEVETESHFIEKFNANLLFAISKKLKTIFLDSFKNVDFLHPLNNIAGKLPYNTEKHSLILYINSHHLYVLLYNESNLLLANSFKNSHPNDTIFFLLTALKQLDISIKNTHLYLAGNQKEIKKTEIELKTYFSKIDHLKPNSETKIPENFSDSQISQIITLLQ